MRPLSPQGIRQGDLHGFSRRNPSHYLAGPARSPPALPRRQWYTVRAGRRRRHRAGAAHTVIVMLSYFIDTMNTTLPKALACPFCASTNLELRPDGQLGSKVACRACQAVGPLADDGVRGITENEIAAIVAWNTRRSHPGGAYTPLVSL